MVINIPVIIGIIGNRIGSDVVKSAGKDPKSPLLQLFAEYRRAICDVAINKTNKKHLLISPYHRSCYRTEIQEEMQNCRHKDLSLCVVNKTRVHLPREQ